MKRSLPLIAAAAALALTGCSVHGLQTQHLPGGATGVFGGKTYSVKVCFADVTALQPQASVRVGDVPVGDIDKIQVTPASSSSCPGSTSTPSGYQAVVTCLIKQSVSLPANSVAFLQQTSLLGEKYVELGPPVGGNGQGRLPQDGSALIPEDKTHGFPDLELVFGALSALLNGGGVEQLQTITKELSAALTGREGTTRDLLHQLDTFVGGLDSNKSEIVRALDNLDRFAKILADQKTTIATALVNIAPGLKILADDEPDLTGLLSSLSNLGVVATRVINETKANTVADLGNLAPVLQKVSQAGTYLPRALEVLLDYPFPRNVTNGIFGDYTGLLADVDLQASVTNLASLNALGLPVTPPSGQTAAPKAPKLPGGKKTPKLPVLPSPPGLPNLPTLPPLSGPINPNNAPTDAGLLQLLLGGLQ